MIITNDKDFPFIYLFIYWFVRESHFQLSPYFEIVFFMYLAIFFLFRLLSYYCYHFNFFRFFLPRIPHHAPRSPQSAPQTPQPAFSELHLESTKSCNFSVAYKV